MRAAWFVPPVLLVAAGCAESTTTAPVAGRVTLNGKPLANAAVTFAPVATGGNIEPGPSSVGTTDADGRYTLGVLGQQAKGAVVGRHKVQIAIREERDSSDDSPIHKGVQLPMRYNAKTTLEFDVPPGGSSGANFDLTVP